MDLGTAEVPLPGGDAGAGKQALEGAPPPASPGSTVTSPCGRFGRPRVRRRRRVEYWQRILAGARLCLRQLL